MLMRLIIYFVIWTKSKHNIVNKLFIKQFTPILSQLSVVLYKGAKDAEWNKGMI